ncbi:CPA1 family monovalent cation:H+ antiporter [Spirosoma oryzae]|uniref:CPA1 family monovalent cation:H+ antiporter n=1 Tax=Spirosoma oryzae TaxID=1469603 RepID=A0A2T0SAR3_9BACT|nr:Na+/H+ antiporter [Spirosoma oryzae]PRY30403.1 CPA1 family monovalent cation:H+ antiporter [Spirosoma oryzae]
MESHLILIITLLLTLIALTMVSTRLGISAPIFLVIAGLGLSLLPGMPPLRVKHDLIFFILLPPLLFRAAWDTHWHEFWENRLQIGLHGVGLVIVTAGGIGLLAHLIIPGFSLAQGLLLGSIIAPPDALAATSILQKVKLPARTVTILEGESLINDATSLILFRFSLVAILSGQFSIQEAGLSFMVDSLLGIGIGCGVAGIIYLIHRFLPTDSTMDTLISLATPYLMYLTAEQVHASGVLAVVSGGLLLSYHASRLLTSQARLQMLGVWNTLTFVLNGLAFVLVGFQLPLIVSRLHPEGVSFSAAIGFGLIFSLALIGIRLACMFPVTHLTQWLHRGTGKQKADLDWQLITLTSWCGMRGVVTLASALSLPPRLLDQSHFPFLALIIFISFSVIVFTLLVQGLSLPSLIRLLPIPQFNADDRQLRSLSTRLAGRALQHIETNYPQEATTLTSFIRQREKYEAIVSQPQRHPIGEVVKQASAEMRYRRLRQELLTVQREELHRLRRTNQYSDGLIRQKEYELDLEQMTIS